MYVCLCRGVTERDIHRAVDAGACSAAEVMRCTRAGSSCGTCVPTVFAIVAARTGEEAAPISTRRRLDVLPELREPALATG